MRILVADDDPVTRRVLEALLSKWDYEVVLACNGREAWQILQDPARPPLAILDWKMPPIDGIEVCRKVRQNVDHPPVYLILLTGLDTKEHIIAGLEAGADDYITKPFDHGELRARVRVGERVLRLQGELADRVQELEAALANIKQLQGLLPICMYCKKIRADKNYWEQVDGYIARHTDARFTHGICPDCYEKIVKPQLDQLDEPESE